MSKAFTPGPWVYDDSEGYGAGTIWSKCSPTGLGGKGRMVATLSGDDAEEEANAHLIAQSPNMYESLQDLIIAMEDAGLGHIDDVEKARTVSRKVLGEHT